MESSSKRNLPPGHVVRSTEARDSFLARYDRAAACWPVECTTQTVETPFGGTFVRISGSDSAPPVVLLHGAGGSSLRWAANVEALAQHFRVIAVDCVYDFGRSTPSRLPENEGEIIIWLDALLDGLALTGDVHFVGHSYGAWVAARYALFRSERVASAVLLAPAATILPLTPVWWVRAVLAQTGSARLTKSFIHWLMTDLPPADLAERVDDALLAGRSFLPRRLVSPTVLSDTDWRRLGARALVLVGALEKIYDARRAVRRLRDVAVGVTTEIVPGAGHGLFASQPKIVNAKIVAFLERPSAHRGRASIEGEH